MKITLTYADYPFLTKPNEVYEIEGAAYAYLMVRNKDGTMATVPCAELAKAEFEMSMSEVAVARQILQNTLDQIEKTREGMPKEAQAQVIPSDKILKKKV